jgi:hypothetical protein
MLNQGKKLAADAHDMNDGTVSIAAYMLALFVSGGDASTR